MEEERDIWGSRTLCFPHQGLLVENEMQAEAVCQGCIVRGRQEEWEFKGLKTIIGMKWAEARGPQTVLIDSLYVN